MRDATIEDERLSFRPLRDRRSSKARGPVYNKFFGLSESPFRITPDPRFLYLGPAHREALATLIYGIRERKGIVALTGGVGTGKTTLLEGLFERLASECIFVRIRDPKADFSAIVRDLLAALGLSSSGVDRSEAMKLLWERLSAADAATINPVLVIDEAQDVRDDVLEDFRLLSNLETHERKLIQMLLVGQPEFRRRLEAPSLEPLRQRIALSTTIHPLTLVECTAYVKHRLSVAGAESEGIFAIGAFEAVHDYARGIPRLINVVCDGALSMGYATGTRPIHAGLIREVVQDLRGEGAAIPAPAPTAASSRPQPVASNPRESRGRGWVAVTAAVCTLALAGVIGGSAIRQSRRPPTMVAAPAAPPPAPRSQPVSTTPEAGPSVPATTGPQAADPELAPPEQAGSPATVTSATADATPWVPDRPAQPARLGEEPTEEATEPRLDGEPEVGTEVSVPRPPDVAPAVDLQARITDVAREQQAAAKREREIQREREREAKAKAAKEAKEKAARDRIAKLKAASRPQPVDEEDAAGAGPVAASSTARGSQGDGGSISGAPITSAEPASTAIGGGGEPKMLIVPDPPEGAVSSPVAISLKVRELYAAHSVGVPEPSPRFVPGDTVQLVAVYELSNPPVGGGDVAIDLWVRGPNQEDMPALGARRVLQGKSGTFQAAVGRKIPANAPAGVYGLVARVSTSGTEARRVFLFRVD